MTIIGGGKQMPAPVFKHIKFMFHNTATKI